ncbi:MAG: RAD55 family ATPase [Candidatus Micrarchaeia archaeon]
MPMPLDLPPMGMHITDYNMPNVKNRAATGIAKLDVLLEGGYPQDSMILVIAPPGIEKLLAAIQFLDSSGESESLIFITTDMSPSAIAAKAAEYGRSKAADRSKVRYIDCYSWTIGKEKEDSSNDIPVQGPNSLNDLSIAINTAMSESSPAFKKRAVFHSLSTLLLYNQPEVVFKFVQVTGARLKSQGATVIYLLESEMHDEKAISTLRHLMDEVMEIRREDGKLKLYFQAARAQKGIPVKVGANGLEID